MPKNDFLVGLLAGFGIGIAAAVLFAPASGDKTRRRIQENADRASGLFKESAGRFRSAAEDVLQSGHAEISRTVNDLRDKAKDTLDEAADTTRKAADQVVDKSKDVAQHMGKKMEETGKRLQNT